MDMKLPNKMIKRVEMYCKEHALLAEGDGVVIGVSGGADSVFLLSFLCAIREAWKLKLCVVHVNHGIRGEAAGADEEYVRSLAEFFSLPFFCYHAEIPVLAKEWKMTEEEAGRNYRYSQFEQVRKKCGFTKIAVAHHVNDQAETVLFQLFRGSGLRGLGGMYPKQDDIIRPLLGLSKGEIVETLEECGIKYCEDMTNHESGYSRNWLRNELFPQVEKRLQGRVQSHIAASASYLREVMSYLEEQAFVYFRDKVKKGQNGFFMERNDFFSCHRAIQSELIFLMIEGLTGRKKDITGVHIEQIRNIFSGETGRKVVLPYQLMAKREYELVSLEVFKGEEKEAFIEQELLAGRFYEIPYTNGEKRYFRTEKRESSGNSKINPKKYCTKCFDYDKINSVALFRHPLAGDYFWLDTSGKKKKLGRFFIDEKIPAEHRKRMVVLAEGNHVLWIPELQRSSAFYYLSGDTKQILCIHETTNYTR